MHDYHHGSSNVFAPVARNGVPLVDASADSYVVESKYLKTYRGLLELEASLPDHLTTPRIVQPPKSRCIAVCDLIALVNLFTCSCQNSINVMRVEISCN